MADLRYLVLVVLATLSTAQVSLGNEPTLKIIPDSILKAVDEGVFVSCTAVVDNTELVTEMSWTAPDGRQITNNMDDTVSTAEDGTEAKLDLFISKLREQDVGNYTCSATYAGNQKLEAKVLVESYMGINFGDTPEHQQLLINEEGKVKCNPIGRPAPLVDWSKNHVPLKNDDNHIIQQDGILITKVTEADEGTYRCRAKVLQMGSIKYIDIQVEVIIPPTIDQPPEDLKGKETESVKFECGATGKPAPFYTWVDKDNRPLENLEGYHVNSETGELTIMELKPEQSGEYRCTASNTAGADSKTAHLQVLTKPHVVEYLNLTKPVGSEAEMRCIVTGSPEPLVVFKKESEPSDFVTGINTDDRISVSQETDDEGRQVGILRIRDVARSDDGLYTCTAQSEGGVTQRWGHITVEFKPTFEDQGPTEVWSWEKAAVNLTCVATSIPNATIQWYLRQQEIDFNDPNLERMALGPVGVLMVNPVSSSYFGSYTCEATNPLGTASLDMELKEAHPPGPISSARVEKKTATTITWSLVDPSHDGGLPIQSYVVQYRERDQSWEGAERIIWTKGSSYTIDNLTPQTTYVFRFAARSKAGDGEWGGEKSVEMPRHAEPEEPLIFAATDRVVEIPYPSHYDLQWQVPLNNGIKIDHFQIVYYQVTEKADKWEAVGEKTTQEVTYPGTTTYKIEGLHANSHYKIELRAHNDIGYSTPAEAIIKTTNGPLPGPSPEQEGLSTGIIAAIIIIVVVVVVVVVDVSCFCTRNAGLTATIAGKRGSKDKDKEAMLEDGKNAREDIQEGNGQMKTQKEEDLKPEQEEDSNKKVKESTEPTETTPMIQRHSLQGNAMRRREALPLRAASQSNVLEISDTIQMQHIRNNLNKPLLQRLPGTETTKTTEPLIVDVIWREGKKVTSNANTSVKTSKPKPLLYQFSDDSLYAKPAYGDTINASSPLGITQPPPPLPKRNKVTHLSQLSQSHEILSDPHATHSEENVTSGHLQSLQHVPDSHDDFNTLSIPHPSSSSCDILGEAPKNVRNSFGSRGTPELGKEELTNRIIPQPRRLPRDRDALNQPLPSVCDNSKPSPVPRIKETFPQAGPRSGYPSGNGYVASLGKLESTSLTQRSTELNDGHRTQSSELDDGKRVENIPRMMQTHISAERHPKTPSISSNSTLYQPADGGYQHNSARTAFMVAPYDDPGCQARPLPTPTHRAFEGLEMHPPKKKTNKHIPPTFTAPTSRGSEKSEVEAPSSFLPHIAIQGLKTKSPEVASKLYSRDILQRPNQSLSMDYLDGPLDTQRLFSNHLVSDHQPPPTVSTAKSLSSLLDSSSSSMRSYGQPTLL